MANTTTSTSADSSSMSSTKDLKRVLGFKDLLGTAIGQIIGSGIMSLTGVAIAMTGRSVPFSFMLSAVLVLFSSITTILISGTVRLRGGQYTMTAMLAGQKFAGVFILLFIMQNISIAMYALSFADYLQAFIPGANRKLVAILVLTFFYVLNLFGIDKASKAQNLIVLMMCIALGLFSAFGCTKLAPGFFAPEGFMTGGVMGMLSAASLLNFATGGGLYIVNLGAEAKNPTRDIPLAIIVSTCLVALLYAFMSVVAAGVLPVEQVAGKPLTLVAKEVLPTPLYVFFVVGGAMFALISTLNAQLQWSTKPVMQACFDGWFPKRLGALSKYKTPHILLTIVYLVGVIPVLIGFDISVIGNLTMIILTVNGMLITANMYKLPKIVPELWEKSKFKVSDTILKAIIVVGLANGVLNIFLQARMLSTPLLIGNVVFLIFAFVYANLRYKTGKVDVEISYEES